MMRFIDLIGVPSEAGGQNGTSGGAESMGRPLEAALVRQGHYAFYWNVREHADAPHIFTLRGKPRGKVRFQKKVAQVADLIAAHTKTSLILGHTPAVIGGDHSVTIGSGRAALEFAVAQRKTIGLLWIDAHLDAHTHKTSHSHNANGMPLAVLLGYGLPSFRPLRQAFLPKHVLHFGRGETYCEREEEVLLKTLGVSMFSAKEFRQLDIAAPWRALVSLLARVDLVWVSFDLDAVDRKYAPGVHLRSNGGLSRTVLLWLAGHIAQSGKLCGVDIMEYKPSMEEYNEHGAGKTVVLASEFLSRLLETP